MDFPLVGAICSKGAVFNQDGIGFEALSAEYDNKEHALILTLKKVKHVKGYKEPDTDWLTELGRAYAEELPIDQSGPPLRWKQIEMHIDADPPRIYFCLQDLPQPLLFQ
jgi:hypothetical protein